jgi:hypothetical protein
MFDSLSNLALDKFAFISQPASSKTWLSSEQNEIDSLNLRRVFAGVGLWLQAERTAVRE